MSIVRPEPGVSPTVPMRCFALFRSFFDRFRTNGSGSRQPGRESQSEKKTPFALSLSKGVTKKRQPSVSRSQTSDKLDPSASLASQARDERKPPA
jgi:hypothetical protein